MELGLKLLSDIVLHSKYAKYLPDKQRRETWEEIVDRNKQMHFEKFKDIIKNNEYLKNEIE